MNELIATPSRTKEILERYDLHARKNYGQNFIVDSGIVDKIARNAMTGEETIALEIGAGIGALTQCLGKYAKKVYAFEIDERLIPVLHEVLDMHNIEIIQQDFMEVDLTKFIEDVNPEGKDVIIAANLPYYITTPILFKLFEHPKHIQKITVMMQKEVADRFNAEINTKEYNALTIVTQYRCKVKLLMNVPRNVFQPKPNVDSAVVQFTFHDAYHVDDEEAFFELVKACFKQRRKTILNNYGEYLNDKDQARKELETAGIEANERAQSLTLERFRMLYEIHAHASPCED